VKDAKAPENLKMTQQSDKLIDNVMAVAGFCVSIFLFLPLTVYSLNPYSVPVELLTILQGGLVFAGLTALVLFLLSYIPGIGRVVKTLCQVGGITVFVMVVIPNRTGEITGFEDPAITLEWVPYIKLVALIAAGFIAAWKWPKHLRTAVSIVLILSIIVSAYMSIYQKAIIDSQEAGQPHERYHATTLGKQENIIVIVPDAFTGYRMVEVFDERPELKERFSGFTLYPRAIASALNTPAGISAILTGDLDIAINIEKQLERNTQSLARSFLKDADRKGFEAAYVSSLRSKPIGISTYRDEDFIMQNIKKSCIFEYLGFFTISMARIVPQAVHGPGARFVQNYLLMRQNPYNMSDIEHFQNMGPGNERKIFGSKIAIEHIIENLKVGDFSKKALFIHNDISHPPYIFDEDGRYMPGADAAIVSIFTTKTIIRLFERLREIGLYDSSLIIVAADHGGHNIDDRSMGGVFEGAFSLDVSLNPLLMVKPPNAKHSLRQSEMSVWLGDVAETARDFLGVQSTQRGVYPVRSLLGAEDVDRKLKVPIFFRPDQEGYHSALANWKEVNVHGTFHAYGAASHLNPIDLLKTGAGITLIAGKDKLRTKQVKGGWVSGSGTQYRAAIEVEDITLANIRQSGIVALSNISGDLEKYAFHDLQEGIQFIQKAHDDTDATLLAAGLKIPDSMVNNFFSDAKMPDLEDGADVNFVYASLPDFEGQQMLDIDTKDVSITFCWE